MAPRTNAKVAALLCLLFLIGWDGKLWNGLRAYSVENSQISFEKRDETTNQTEPTKTGTNTSGADDEAVHNLPILPPPEFQSISIVVLTTGELGNYLHRLAYARGMHQLARSKYGIRTALVIRLESRAGRTQISKFKNAERQLQACFPTMNEFIDFQDTRNGTVDVSSELDQVRGRQDKIFGKKSFSLDKNSGTKGIEEVLKNLRFTLESLHGDYERNYTKVLDELGNTTISLPFISTVSMTTRAIMDQYYDDFRSFFSFHDKALGCCKARPDSDESAFHFRNFVHEMPKRGLRYGLEELSPNKTATELFGHLPAGSKVALVSRFADHPQMDEYVRALSPRLNVRIIRGNSGIQDFCFLQQTKQELVAMVKSTYAVWAGYLSNSTTRLYSVRSPVTQALQDKKGVQMFRQINWTHPELRERIRFELHNSEEMDKVVATENLDAKNQANNQTPSNGGF